MSRVAPESAGWGDLRRPGLSGREAEEVPQPAAPLRYLRTCRPHAPRPRRERDRSPRHQPPRRRLGWYRLAAPPAVGRLLVRAPRDAGARCAPGGLRRDPAAARPQRAERPPLPVWRPAADRLARR